MVYIRRLDEVNHKGILNTLVIGANKDRKEICYVRRINTIYLYTLQENERFVNVSKDLLFKIMRDGQEVNVEGQTYNGPVKIYYKNIFSTMKEIQRKTKKLYLGLL